MANKNRPARRPSRKLVAGARGYVLDTYEKAAELLTELEILDLIEALREDLHQHAAKIEHGRAVRRRKRPRRRTAP